MSADPKLLGTLRPLGGGDPIPLKKEEMVVGRRPTCDIRLEFENISGKHCLLKFVNGTWHVRDLGSTNGTSVNGQRISSEHGVMPDDELGIATHLYSIDYEPLAPLVESHQVLEDGLVETRKHTSLLELAGIEDEDNPRRRPKAAPHAASSSRSQATEDADFNDALPADFRAPEKPEPQDSDDFFRLIEDEVKKPKN